MFKNVFFQDKDLLKWLIDRTMSEFVPNRDISNINVKNCELVKDRLFIKNKTVDMLVETDEAYFNLEMNPNYFKTRKYRNLFKKKALALSLIRVEDNYVDLDKPIIQINYNIIQYKTENYISRYLSMKETTIEPLFFHKYKFLLFTHLDLLCYTSYGKMEEL